MKIVKCYSRDQLQDFLLGKLPDEKSGLVAQHLDHCEICEDTIVGLEAASDTLVGLLSQKELDAQLADSPDATELPEYRAAVERIQNLDFDHGSSESQTIDQIGEYEIGEQIGTGGMGSVYRARHMRLEKPVAIKLLPERKMQNADAIARFSREMKIIGQMDHPSMVRATDAGDIKGMHFLVMELVEGLDLGRIIRLCGRLKPENAAEVVRSAAIGLHYAHERGVVHRDVKPSNLMLNRDGAVKILDLGLATLGGLHGTVDELTTVGQLMGTLDYMAPEQCGNHHTVDSRTDIYGLGATLYKLLTGNAPYSNPLADTPLKKLKAMAVDNPTPILDRRPDLLLGLAAIVDKCLERDPAKRFQTAHELAVALDPFTTGHVLKSLLNSAERLKSQQGEPALALVPVSIEFQRPNSKPKAKLQPKTPISQPAIPQPKMSWFGKSIATVALLLAAGFIAWGGITIYLNTQAGQLVIKSEIDNIKISVVQDEKPTKEIQIEHGSRVTRLRAGKYQIEILGETDGLVIDNDRFELKRGEKVVVNITRRVATDVLAGDTNIAANQLDDSDHTKSGSTSSVLGNGMNLAELQSNVAVAKVKLDFANKKSNQVDAQFKQGLRSIYERDEAQMEQQLAALDLVKTEQLLSAFSEQSRAESDSATPPKRAKNAADLPRVDARNLELIYLEFAVKAAAIRLKQKQQQMVLAQEIGEVSGNVRMNYELAKLEYGSAQSKLDASKASIAKQYQRDKRALELDVAKTQQEYNRLRDVLEHSQSLFKKGFITQSQVSANEFNLVTANQQLKTLNEQLDEMNLDDRDSVSNAKSVAPPTNTTTADDELSYEEAFENQPIYQGEPLVYYLNVSIDQSLRNIRPGVEELTIPAIKQLIPLTSRRYLEKLFNDTIARYENEVDLNSQFRVIYSLGLLCDGESETQEAALTDRLLEYAMAIRVRSFPRPANSQPQGVVVNLSDALQPLTESHFDKVQQFLILKYDGGDPASKTAGLDWLDSQIQDTHQRKNKTIADLAVSKKWVPLLVKDTENPTIGALATRALAILWSDEPVVLEHFKELLGSLNQDIRHQAIWFLADRTPELAGLAQHASTAVQEGMNPDIYVRLIDHGGLSLIEEYLKAPQPRDDESLARFQLLNSILVLAKKGQLDNDVRNQLTGIIRNELDQDEHSSRVLNAAWEAFSTLSGELIPELSNGHRLEYWQRKFASNDSSRKEKTNCLTAFSKLDRNLSEGTLLAIAVGLRGGNHELETAVQDLDLENRAVVYLKGGDEKSSFLHKLDSLGKQDFPFALFVLSRLHYSNDTEASAVLDYIEPSLESTDHTTRRRAEAVLCTLASGSLGRSNAFRFRIAPKLTELMESDKVSIEEKMSILAACRNGTTGMLYKLSNSFDPEDLKPTELVTFLQLAIKGDAYGAVNLCLKLLAKNEKYLDSEFEPIQLDLWHAPSVALDQKSEGANPQKPIDQILGILEIYGENLQPIRRSLGDLDPAGIAVRNAATQTLQERLKTATGASKKKIQRAIERLTREPQD